VTGQQLLAALEREGFSVVRRSQSYVWVGRGKDVLMLDHDGEVDDEIANRLLAEAQKPPP
jgi:crotonobetainyl-CoA:carnitine CoA-transferase CaiB-like acyl-CoA transferase